MQQKCISGLLLLLSLYIIPVKAQQTGYKEYRPEDNSVKIFSLFKNRSGYLLAGTSDGLYKFDGISFNKVETGRQNITDTVTCIFQDNKNDTWIGCNSGRIAKAIKGKLQYPEQEKGMPQKRITSFVQDAKGNIWFGTAGAGLFCFLNQKLYAVNESNGLSDPNIHTLALGANGDILAGTDQGINICSITGNRITVRQTGPSQGLPDYIVTAIFPAGNNGFWIGLQEKGFCFYDHSSGKIQVPAVTAGWNRGQVSNLWYTQEKLWITTQDSGLICYLPSSGQLLPLANMLRQRSLGSITEDNQGNMWAVADNNALVRVASNVVRVLPLYDPGFFTTVHTILADDENNFWAGTDMAVVKYTYNGTGYIEKRYPVNGLDIKTDITSLFRDKFSNIWIGSMGRGIFVLDPVSGKTRQLKEAMANGSILSISGSGNTVCTAGLEGAMVFELSDDNADISNNYRFTSYNKIETIGSNYIYNVFKDSRGRLWFATDGKGLTMLYNGVYSHYNNASGIKDEHIYSVTEDKAGRIWFSTSNAGVYSFDGKNFVNYGIKEGLSSLFCGSVKTDKLGNILVVHKQGVDIINPSSGRISYINTAQGISGINDDLGAACTNTAGDAFFAAQKGIVQYSPVPAAVNYPQTVIENVQLFLNDIDTAVIHYFNYDENNFTFNFAGLYYTDPENVFFEYKLEGLYNAWQFTADNSKAFPKLPPGKYVFRVRSSLNKNFTNASEASYVFEIARPFWRTWWFITGVVVLVTGLLYWYIRRREYHLTHVQELKNEKVKFEFEVLRNQVNPHFLFNSFNTLISTIEEDPKAGVEYVEQLSDFFRNIVNYRDKDTISLQEEISLLQNYIYLQQKRYGSSLALEINIPEKEQERIYLPPLTLQLLMENAIKHNVVSKEALLKIELHIANDYLIVQNNINRKISKEKGTGMGLQNIISRYALLHEKPVEVNDTGKDFIVRLPILKH